MWNLTGTVKIDAEHVGTAEGTVLQHCAAAPARLGAGNGC